MKKLIKLIKVLSICTLIYFGIASINFQVNHTMDEKNALCREFKNNPGVYRSKLIDRNLQILSFQKIDLPVNK